MNDGSKASRGARKWNAKTCAVIFVGMCIGATSCSDRAATATASPPLAPVMPPEPKKTPAPASPPAAPPPEPATSPVAASAFNCGIGPTSGAFRVVYRGKILNEVCYAVFHSQIEVRIKGQPAQPNISYLAIRLAASNRGKTPTFISHEQFALDIDGKIYTPIHAREADALAGKLNPDVTLLGRIFFDVQRGSSVTAAMLRVAKTGGAIPVVPIAHEDGTPHQKSASMAGMYLRQVRLLKSRGEFKHGDSEHARRVAWSDARVDAMETACEEHGVNSSKCTRSAIKIQDCMEKGKCK